MIYGGYSDDSKGKSRAMHNTKIFITNMMSICKHLEMLLTDVYLAAYGGCIDDVKFIIRPTPRIEVNSVEEICQLLDAGVVSFDNAMHLSNMILGVDLQQGVYCTVFIFVLTLSNSDFQLYHVLHDPKPFTIACTAGIGARANAGQYSRAYITPSNKKDLIVAEKAQQQKKGSSK